MKMQGYNRHVIASPHMTTMPWTYASKNSSSRIIDQHACMSSRLQCASIVFLHEGGVKVKRKSCDLSRSCGPLAYWGFDVNKEREKYLGKVCESMDPS